MREAQRSEPDIRAGAIAQVLADERERAGKVAALVRLVGCLGGMPVAFVVGRAQPILELLCVYAGLGIALAVAIRYSRRVSRWSWLGILLLDVPFILASRFQYFTYGTDSSVQAGLLVAFSLLLVIAASTTLHRTAVVLTAATAAVVCGSALVRMGGGP